MFWKASPDAADVPAARPRPSVQDRMLLVPVAALAIVTVAIGLGAGEVFPVARGGAAVGLVSTVLGGSQ